MKRIFAMVLAIAVLTGCTPFHRSSYVSVTPHDEDYQVAVDSSALTVSGYLSLKNAILGLVEDAVEEGVIRAESYSGDLSQDLSSAVYEVSRGDPLGAFAVDYMTYDFSQIVSYYEIHIHTTYQRTLEEIQSVKNTSGVEGVRSRLRDAMGDYESLLRIRVEDYGSLNIEELVQQVFEDNADFAVELPQTEVKRSRNREPPDFGDYIPLSPYKNVAGGLPGRDSRAGGEAGQSIRQRKQRVGQCPAAAGAAGSGWRTDHGILGVLRQRLWCAVPGQGHQPWVLPGLSITPSEDEHSLAIWFTEPMVWRKWSGASCNWTGNAIMWTLPGPGEPEIPQER